LGTSACAVFGHSSYEDGTNRSSKNIGSQLLSSVV